MFFAHFVKHKAPSVPRAVSSISAAIVLFVARIALPITPAAAADIPKPSLAAISTQAAPGDDFYNFANAPWIAVTKIPADHTSWGPLQQMSEDNWQKMAQLYQDASHGEAGTSPAEKRIGDYYMAQMDEAGRDARGMAPIKPLLEEIAALDTKTALARYLGAHLRADATPVNLGIADSDNLFGLWVGPGLHDPQHYTAYLVQGGLALRDKDFYLAPGAESQAQRELYLHYIADMLSQAGIDNAPAKAEKILKLETRIAAEQASQQESQDFAKVDQVWRRQDFASQASGMDWNAYFDAAGLSSQPSFGVWQVKAIKGISALLATTPLDQWKDYLSFHTINASARFLSKGMADRYFAFFDPQFLGPGQHAPLWEHAVIQTNTFMPDAGRLFVKHYFTPQAKTRAQEIAGNIVTAFDQRIDAMAWMSPAARKEARAKLKNLIVGVGYPDKWRDSSALQIRVDDAPGNALRAEKFNYQYEIAKLGQVVDRREWILGAELFGINPMPVQNLLTIPAFELQAPMFDPDGDDAINYATTGARIAHFISRGFGERGHHFDAKGKLRNWWSTADAAHFKASTASLIEQYSRYKPFPDMALSGKQTLAVNLADMAGLQVAYDAFHLALKAKHSMEDSKTADQRFFIAYAQSYRLQSTEEALRGQVAGSPVAPEMYRVATVRNLDAWYAAFDVKPGQALYLAPNERVKIW